VGVSVPAEFRVEPRSQTVSQGQTVTLDCVADGHPAPEISWRRGRTGLDDELSLDQRITVLHNHSLRSVRSLKPRLHDTTCCQTGCQTGLTTG